MRDEVMAPPLVGPQIVGHGRRRRVILPVAVAAIVLCVALGVITSLLLLDARAALKSGVVQLKDVQARLTVSDRQQTDAETFAYVRVHVNSAASDFHRAHERLQYIAPILREFGWVPRVGGEVSGSPDIASMADSTGAGLRSLVGGVQPVVLAAGAGGHLRLSAALPRIAANRPEFQSACASFDRARKERRAVQSGGLGTLAPQLRTFDRAIGQLRVACRALMLLPSMLGYPKARSYLLVYQNPAELRAAGGFIGSAGILNLVNGKVLQEFHGTDFKDENYSIPSPEPVQYDNTEPFWLFRDSNWSPNYPTTAALERYFLNLDLHRTVVGTINITPAVAQSALAVVGSQYIPQYHKLVTPDNVAQLADYYANWSTTPSPGVSTTGDIHGKQFINLVAQRLLSRLEHLSLRTWLKLVQALQPAVAQRDIQINFTNRSAQSLVRMMHADGSVSATTTDYLYVVDTNLSYNKINPFVHRSIQYNVRIRPDRWLESTLTLRFTNDAPASLAAEGIGPGAGRLGGPLDYADFVRVLVPAGAQLTNQRGWWQAWDPGPAYGKMMFCGYLLLRHGHSATVQLSYVMPPNVFSVSHGSRYVLYIQHQAGSHPESLRVHVQGSGVAGRSWSWNGPVTDITVSQRITARPFTPIPLPSGSAAVVAPGRYIEPHAYLAAPGSTQH